MVSLLIQLLAFYSFAARTVQLILCSQTFIFKADKIVFGTFLFCKEFFKIGNELY